uniref:Copper homeostasis protein cutC homolog n=1 Tax=Coturnix japonica TaxID=93934 RepID=A0A8C2UAA8_COTJA
MRAAIGPQRAARRGCAAAGGRVVDDTGASRAAGRDGRTARRHRTAPAASPTGPEVAAAWRKRGELFRSPLGVAMTIRWHVTRSQQRDPRAASAGEGAGEAGRGGAGLRPNGAGLGPDTARRHRPHEAPGPVTDGAGAGPPGGEAGCGAGGAGLEAEAGGKLDGRLRGTRGPPWAGGVRPRRCSPGMDDGFLMEVCVDSVESAVNAERGGLLQVVKQCVRIPVFVMIRPRGGDFLYSDREVEVMKADIRLAKLHGADGLVFGALTEDGRIDTELCTALLAVCRPLPVTFHRAFDMVHDPQVALETLISLGFERVLTSGCDSSALEGLSLIKKLAEQAKGRIVVVPGGGITERNLQRILEGSSASEFHCSARSARDSGMKFRNPNVAMGASFSAPEYSVKVADVAKVRTLNAIAKNIL